LVFRKLENRKDFTMTAILERRESELRFLILTSAGFRGNEEEEEQQQQKPFEIWTASGN
jgi:hypothetical protein